MLFRNGITSLLEVIKQFSINCRVSFTSITLYNNCDKKKSAFIQSVLRMKFVISTCFGKALYFRQCCMKISFFSHNLLMLSSLIRNKIFCGIQTHSCDKIHFIQWYNNEAGEKKVKGELKEQKINVFPKRAYASVLNPPSLPLFLFDQSYVNWAMLTKYLKSWKNKVKWN